MNCSQCLWCFLRSQTWKRCLYRGRWKMCIVGHCCHGCVGRMWPSTATCTPQRVAILFLGPFQSFRSCRNIIKARVLQDKVYKVLGWIGHWISHTALCKVCTASTQLSVFWLPLSYGPIEMFSPFFQASQEKITLQQVCLAFNRPSLRGNLQVFLVRWGGGGA